MTQKAGALLEQTDTPPLARLVTYGVTDALIAETREKCSGLTCDTPAGYEETRIAIRKLRDTRVAIEKRRVELKADALAYFRTVDSEAKRLTVLIEAIEDPLKAKKDVIDDEKARVKAEADAAALAAVEAEMAAERAQEEAQAQAVRDAEEARLAEARAQLAAERLKLDEERRQANEKAEAAQRIIDAERAKLAEERRAEEERQRAERKKEEDRQRVAREVIETERRAVEAERQQAERAEFERLAKIKAEAEAVARAERDRLAAAEQAAKIAALAPDVEKLRAFSDSIRSLVDLRVPKPKATAAKKAILRATDALELVARGLDDAIKEMSLASRTATK